MVRGDRRQEWVTLLSFSAAALKIAVRDRWIGWSYRQQRARREHRRALWDVCVAQRIDGDLPVREGPAVIAARGLAIAARRPPAGVCFEERYMRINNDQVKGRIAQAKGAVKEMAGTLAGDAKLQANGKVQKKRGTARAKYGDVKRSMKSRGA